MNRDREVLERRYQRLLHAYPAAYRRERGTEMLDTLLHDHPGGRWPSIREAWALLSGGLRVRSGVTAPVPLWVSLRQVGLLAALLIICRKLVVDLENLADYGLLRRAMLESSWRLPLSWSAFVASEWWSVAEITGYAAAAVLVCRRRPGLAMAAVAIPTAMTGYLFATTRLYYWELALNITISVMLTTIVSGRRLPALPGAWVWTVGLFTAALVAFSVTAEAVHASPGVWQVEWFVELYGPWLLAAAWTIIDARPALAVVVAEVMALTTGYLALAMTYFDPPSMVRYGDYLPLGAQLAPTTWAMWGAGILVLAAAVRLRRLAAL